MTALIVNIEKEYNVLRKAGFEPRHSYEYATRRAWPLAVYEANAVSSVVGLIRGQVHCVIVGCYAVRDEAMKERFQLVEGDVYTASQVLTKNHDLMFKRLGSTRGHRYGASIQGILDELNE
ncbi:hypothetical protein [Aeromonas veronii]|uniref:hypothetical protein n=1 Tax=Aeromonas veronii TaxID=654 RepID=UPI003D1DA775